MSVKSERPYEIVKREETEIGRFVIIKDIIKINGKEYPYSYERTDDSVVVLPIYKDKIILIYQYRHGLNGWYWEVPAGGLSGQLPIKAAERELLEETGYVASRMISIGKYPCSLGTSSSHVHIYVAECSSCSCQELEDTELIEVYDVTVDKFEEMIESRDFIHSHGIVAWEMYKKMSDEEKNRRAV